MQTTNNLGLKKPGAEDVVNIEDLNSNSDVLDGKFGASSGHGHTGAAGDGPKIGSGSLVSGAATDTVIGSRTVSDTTAPTGDSGTPTTLFGWLANMIKAITGGATWRTLPGMTIAAIKTILDAATNAGTASTLMKRDASGRAQVAAPSAATDIVRKDTVDAVQSNLTTHAAVGSTAHGATSAPTVNTLMSRDSAGRAQVVAPSVSADIANKGYVDTAVSGATIPDASLTVKGKVQLSSAVNSTSEVLAATPKAVKDAYDRGSAGVTVAEAALPKDGSQPMNGLLTLGNGYVIDVNGSSEGSASHGAGFYYLDTSGAKKYAALSVNGSGHLTHYTNDQWHYIWHSGNDGAGSGLDADIVKGSLGMNVFAWHTDPKFRYDGTKLSWSNGYLVRGNQIGSITAGSITTQNDRWIIGTISGASMIIDTALGWGANLTTLTADKVPLGYIGQNDILSLFYGAGSGLSRNNAGVFEFFDYTTGGWKPVGGIKNVQRGSITPMINNANIQTADITISTVNMSKSFVTFNNNVTNGTYNVNAYASASLTSSTNLRIQYQPLVTNVYVLNWEVVEFY